MYASCLKTNRLDNPMGIDPGAVYVSWVCREGVCQSAFQITVDGDVQFDSGKLCSCKTEYALPISIPSRAACRWSVTLWDENDRRGEPRQACFETGLSPEDWVASWIDPEPEDLIPAQDNQSLNTASYLRRKFFCAPAEKARLYITAHGIYDVWINGIHVDGYFLAPGSGQYDQRLQAQTYDVAALLKSGENEILVSIGDGWWRGCFGWAMRRNCWSDRLALLCQLEVDGALVLCSDATWQASQNGPLGLNDPMQLQSYDARKQIAGWHGVRIVDFGYGNLVGTMLPVTPHERFAAKLLHMPNGELVLDFGQNMAGFVELNIHAAGGERILLTHGEVLDADGNFQTRNFQNSAEPWCHQRIEYICAPGQNFWHPTKGYYGFRYVKVETELAVTAENFTAVAVYSDMKQTGYFRCGHQGVNRLFENCLWSMKSNFVDIPTDCPHREKAGFTGDLQVFSDAALYLMDCYPVLARYMRECAAGQLEDGRVRQVVPHYLAGKGMNGSAGWCDAFEIVTERLMRRFDSTALAGEIYTQLKRWMVFCIERAKPSRAENESLPEHIRQWLVDTGTHWGEWCEPGVTVADYKQERETTGHAEIATAFLSHGCSLMSKIAARLGEKADALFFAEAAQKAAAAYRYVYMQGGKISSDRQCHYVRPVAFGITEGEQTRQAVEALVALIRDKNNCIGTGFLTTCYLCQVLSDHGYPEVAYDLLLNEKQPGWLFEVTQGATTLWENWFAIRPTGERRSSHNHYAFGSIAGWLMGQVAGIRVENGHVTVRPITDRRLGFVEASYDSPLGTVAVAWRYEGEALHVQVTIPPNATATVELPNGSHEVTTGCYRYEIDCK